jgi:hypothetical protein
MYYSPILFLQIADLTLTQYHSCHIDMDYLNSKEKIIVFCFYSMVYINKLLPFLNNVSKPFVLITAMEDTQLPLEIDISFMNKILLCPFFKHWFSVNKTIPNDNIFTSIPYGLNYWTLATRPCFGENIQTIFQQNTALESVIKEASHFSQRIPKIYCNFHFNLSDIRHGGMREKLLNIIPKDIVFIQQQVLPRTESYKATTNYSFVLSPFGNGLDCIRTFESLCLGCIVIIKKSALDISMYEDLPVLFIDEWTDINETLLNKTLEEFKNKQFNYDKLKFEYWANLVITKF